MRGGRQFTCGRAKTDRHDDFVDQFRGLRADARATNQTAAVALGDEFHETIGRPAHQGFPVIGKEIFRDDECNGCD